MYFVRTSIQILNRLNNSAFTHFRHSLSSGNATTRLMTEEKTDTGIDLPIPTQNYSLQPASSLEAANPVVTGSFNLAAYVNNSQTLQQLVNLGVAIEKWDKIYAADNSWIVKLDFEKDIQPVVKFLVDIGVDPNGLGMFFTKNPFILNPHSSKVEDLFVRTNYLLSKKFTPEMIANIYTRNPFWPLFRYYYY